MHPKSWFSPSESPEHPGSLPKCLTGCCQHGKYPSLASRLVLPKVFPLLRNCNLETQPIWTWTLEFNQVGGADGSEAMYRSEHVSRSMTPTLAQVPKRGVGQAPTHKGWVSALSNFPGPSILLRVNEKF